MVQIAIRQKNENLTRRMDSQEKYLNESMGKLNNGRFHSMGT